MSAPSRFPGGVTNAAVSESMGMLGMLDPTKFHAYFEDFDRFAAGEWVITTTEAGTGAATEALTDADGGVLLITNDDADNDADFFQKVGESFLMEAGKKAWFKARFKVSEGTQSDVIMGLQITDTTPLDATDGIYFIKADDAATISFVCRKNATTGSTSASAGTLASDTWTTWAWFYDGKSEVKAFVDGRHVATLDASSTFLPDTELTVSFGLQNGSAGAKTMSVDYIFAAKER